MAKTLTKLEKYFYPFPIKPGQKIRVLEKSRSNKYKKGDVLTILDVLESEKVFETEKGLPWGFHEENIAWERI